MPKPKSAVPIPTRPPLMWKTILLFVAVIFPTLLAILLLMGTSIPLGIVGEWVWNRAALPPYHPLSWAIPLIALGTYVALALLGGKWLAKRREAWLVVLGPLALLVASFWHWSLMELPNPGAGPERWPASLYFQATSGYFTVARSIDDLGKFLTNYASWTRQADNFHLGTHPPGLIVLQRLTIEAFQKNPEAGSQLERITPSRLIDGFQIIDTPLPPAERSALIAIALGTWLASLLTMIPIYGLVRIGGTKVQAWWAALFWPVVPAASLFIPVGDSLYPLLAMTILWLLLGSFRLRMGLIALLAGAILWIGMMLSLAFVVVAAIGGLTIIYLSLAEGRFGRGLITLLAFGAGMALPTEILYDSLDLNLVEVWRINLAKHAGFYEAMPRSYLPWIMIDLVEFAVVAGPGLFLVATIHILARGGRKDAPAIDRLLLVWLILLIMLDLSGRNRSEVARLWLFLAPMVMMGAGRILGEPKGSRIESQLPTLALVVSALLSLAAMGWTEPLLPVALGP